MEPLVWVDCEMTGLNAQKDQIIEICVIVTNGSLEIQGEEFHSVVHCPPELLAGMDDWCTKTHTESGLVAQIPDAPSLAEVQNQLNRYLDQYLGTKKGMLAGNSVHADMTFLRKDFPAIASRLHYRIVDVTSVSQIIQRHNPKLAKKVPPKKKLHTAKSDILESIAELQWYYDNYFISS